MVPLCREEKRLQLLKLLYNWQKRSTRISDEFFF